MKNIRKAEILPSCKVKNLCFFFEYTKIKKRCESHKNENNSLQKHLKTVKNQKNSLSILKK